jgi:hypothetical protein
LCWELIIFWHSTFRTSVMWLLIVVYLLTGLYFVLNLFYYWRLLKSNPEPFWIMLSFTQPAAFEVSLTSLIPQTKCSIEHKFETSDVMLCLKDTLRCAPVQVICSRLYVSLEITDLNHWVNLYLQTTYVFEPPIMKLLGF